MDDVDTKKLLAMCEDELAKAGIRARSVVSPAQLLALEADGLQFAPAWMLRTLLNVLAKAAAIPPVPR